MGQFQSINFFFNQAPIHRNHARSASFKNVCAALAVTVWSALWGAAAQAQVAVAIHPPLQSQEFRVTLLGTGSPPPSMRRFGRS